MASVHIPIFMDGKLYTKYQGKRYIDVILLFYFYFYYYYYYTIIRVVFGPLYVIKMYLMLK